MHYARHAAVAATAFMLTAGSAFAATKCNIVGSFTDTLGSKGKFTSEMKGTVDNPVICPKPYDLTVEKLTLKVIDVKGTAPGSSCGALTGSFKFLNGGCTKASGTVTIAKLGTFKDTITRTGKVRQSVPVDDSALSAGLR